MRWDDWRGSFDGRPTMWIRRLFSFRGRAIDAHKFVGADDPGCFHTHSARCFRIVLWGGYVEELEGGKMVTHRPGSMGFVRPELSHRVHALCNGRVSYSLWLRGRKTAKIELRGQGWAEQDAKQRAKSIAIAP